MTTQTLPQVVSLPQPAPAVELSQQEFVDLIEARNVLPQFKAQIESMNRTLGFASRLPFGIPTRTSEYDSKAKEHSRRILS